MKPALLYYALLPLVCLAWFSPAKAATVIPEDGHSAVILAYHRIGEDEYPDSNISTEQFLSHVEEIEKGGYNVVALPALLDAVHNNETLPPRTLAITFEGAFKSALTNAIPALLEKNIPFTVFYSSGYADQGSGLYMDWGDLKELANHKEVSLGILPASYTRLKDASEDEIRRQLNNARKRYRDMIGGEAQFFSYPFGEYSPAYVDAVKESGFAAAFGLQSGAVFGSSDFYALPRFTMTEKYGDIDRFRTVAQALAFPVHDVEPQGTDLDGDKPAIGFSVPDYLASGLKSMSCFVTGQSDPEVQILDTRVEIRLKEPVDEDRIRVNCTIPGPDNAQDDTPSWRWFGMLLASKGAGDDPADDDDTGASQPPPALP